MSSANAPKGAAAAAAIALQIDPLVRAWGRHVASPDDATAGLLEAIAAAVGDLDPAPLSALLRSIGDHERRLTAQVAAGDAIRADLVGRIESLTEEPRPVARLVRVDLVERRAIVATSPGSSIEVGLDSELDPATIAPGNDCILTSARSAILSDCGAPGPASGGVRLVTFHRWWGLAGLEGRAARVTAEQGASVATVPPALVAAVEALASDPSRTLQLLVDRFDQVIAIDGQEAPDPMLLAKPFVMSLAEVGADRIAGLAEQRRKVEAAVKRAAVSGAFVIAQGPPGTGKTLLAGYARRLLAATGKEVVVLGLDANREQMFYRQEEAQILELCAAAQALARAGKLVIIFLDEIDRLFHTSRTYGQSVHDNAVRATILEQLGGRMAMEGILVYATTNKAASLPSELQNRAQFLLTFEALGAEDARSILDVHVAPDDTGAAARDEVLDAVVDFVYDASPDAVVSTAVLRDQSELAIRRRDLKQVSGRLWKDLAARFADDCAARSNGTRARLGVEAALRITRLKFAEIVAGVDLTPENLGERTFLKFAAHNPPVEVRLRAQASAPASWFRYEPAVLPAEASHA